MVFVFGCGEGSVSLVLASVSCSRTGMSEGGRGCSIGLCSIGELVAEWVCWRGVVVVG